jgi:hypothetical protein
MDRRPPKPTPRISQVTPVPTPKTRAELKNEPVGMRLKPPNAVPTTPPAMPQMDPIPRAAFTFLIRFPTAFPTA